MYDVIVIGCGVAGGYLASRLENLNVLVLEKDKKVSLKDTGIVSKHFDIFFNRKSLIKDKISKMVAVSPSGKEFSLSSDEPYAYLLNRKKLSHHLRKITPKIRYESAGKIIFGDDRAIVITNKNEYSCRMVVGADGANSIVRKSMKIRDTMKTFGIMAFTNKIPYDDITVFFNKHFSPDFYSWVVPKNKEYGLMSCVRPKEYLDFFRNKTGLKQGKLYGYPMSYGYTKSYYDNSILIGDSCGHAKPASGGGIIFALRASLHAERTIKQAFSKGRFDSNFLKSYEDGWKSELGYEIDKQMFFRKMYRHFTNKDIDELFNKFGPYIEKMNNFDYDKISKIWKAMPKMKMAFFMARRLGLLAK